MTYLQREPNTQSTTMSVSSEACAMMLVGDDVGRHRGEGGRGSRGRTRRIRTERWHDGSSVGSRCGRATSQCRVECRGRGARVGGVGGSRRGGADGLDLAPALTLVHRSSVVAVENVFIVAFLSSASARGQWKSAFPLAVILEPPVKRAFSLAVFLRNRQ
jgi:hypothetical protein